MGRPTPQTPTRGSCDNAAAMFLKRRMRGKDGKDHTHGSVCERPRVRGGRTVQRQLLRRGELNTRQHDSWQHTLEVLREDGSRHQRRLFADHEAGDVVEVKLATFAVKQPRRFGDCRVGGRAWEQLGLRTFREEQLADEAGAIPWAKVLELLAVNRPLAPRSELCVHEKWFAQPARGILRDADAAVAGKDRLYRCLGRIVAHKPALEQHPALLRERGAHDLGGAPKRKLQACEQKLLDGPRTKASAGVEAQLVPENDEVHGLCRRAGRKAKEQARRQPRPPVGAGGGCADSSATCAPCAAGWRWGG